MKKIWLFSLLGCLLLATLVVTLWPSDPDQARWDDYLQRLSRLTRQPVPPPGDLPLHPYPGARQLQLPTPRASVNLLDFLTLRRCQLITLVSQHNSSLGKVQAASLDLGYQVAFIRRTRQCLRQQRLEDATLTRTLAQVVADKVNALPGYYWNAVVNSDELRHFFNQSPQARAGDLPSSLEALQFLVARPITVRQLPATPLTRLEQQLTVLAHNQGGGYLLRRLALSNRELRRANRMLAAVNSARLCPGGQHSTRARYLRNLLDHVWGPKVQRALAEATRNQQQLDTLTDKLATLVSPTPASFARWRSYYFGPGGLRDQQKQALHRHVQLWQALLGDCGLMPGQR
ncbi:MAG: DUF3080 family protein [Alcanivorax sp.]|nr:DUF3080 family protein [Alcanivorax sp.]